MNEPVIELRRNITDCFFLETIALTYVLSYDNVKQFRLDISASTTDYLIVRKTFSITCDKSLYRLARSEPCWMNTVKLTSWWKSTFCVCLLHGVILLSLFSSTPLQPFCFKFDLFMVNINFRSKKDWLIGFEIMSDISCNQYCFYFMGLLCSLHNKNNSWYLWVIVFTVHYSLAFLALGVHQFFNYKRTLHILT